MNIAVLTRTQNRPLLLRRALYGLLNQTIIPEEWIVVIDGGDIREVESLANLARDSGICTKIIVNDSARGMETASNQGLEKVDCEYFLIHDDDDSIESNYIARMKSFASNNTNVAGIVSLHNLIIEKIVDGEITRLNKSAGNQPKFNFDDLLVKNQWPPISIVVKTTIAREIGGFDESLPVLGDWDFNLKLARRFKIGLLNENLANYHHRTDLSGPNSNTVVAKKDLHAKYRKIVLERYSEENQ